MPSVSVLAQTFYINANETPSGVFIAAVDLCFAYKDDSLPVTVGIVPTVNGIPDTTKIINNAQVSVYPDDVATTRGIGGELPDFTDSTTYTRFHFPGLVYLAPGEYAITVKSNSVKYLAYIARIQDQILGSDRIVSNQPYVGSLYKSQNSDTWAPYQNEDLMFRLIRAKFNINSTGIVDFRNLKVAANANIDLFCVNSNDINFGGTDISYLYRDTDTSGVLGTSNISVFSNKNYYPDDRGILNTNNGSFRIVTTLTSDSDFISPIVDPTRLNLTVVENLINDGGISNNNINMTVFGTGYVGAAPTVSISLPTRAGGVQAVALANVTPSKTIDRIYITIPGSGYIETPTISIAHPTNDSANANAVAIITGETSKTGGNAIARYMTRKVVLSNEFDASDIQAYITAVKPIGTDIQLYYKVMSRDDADQNFDNKFWKRMNIVSGANNVFSKSSVDQIEYQYVTPNGNCQYSSGTSTFDTFNTFAVKICLFSSNPTIIPVVDDLRAIALS